MSPTPSSSSTSTIPPSTSASPPADWSTSDVTLSKNDHRSTASRLDFLSTDPHIVALPVNAFQVSSLGAKVYQKALDPFKFLEAGLIANNGSGHGYGEVPFKLDPANPAYVRMNNRLVRRLFGDFAPARSDLVLGNTGELIGVMFSANICALVTNFLPARTLPTGASRTVLGHRRTHGSLWCRRCLGQDGMAPGAPQGLRKAQAA